MASNAFGCGYSLVHELSIRIKVKDFLNNTFEPGQQLALTNTEIRRTCGCEWAVKICRVRISEDGRENIGLFLILTIESFHVEVESLTCELYVVGKNEEKLKNTGKVKMMEESYGYSVPKFITRSEIQSDLDLYLSNGCLTIQCEAVVKFRPQLLLKLEPKVEVDSSSPVSNTVKKIYEESICSDLLLKSGSSEFICHKVILAAISVYFEIAFRKDTKREYDLSSDVNEDELRALLDYAYLNQRQFPNLCVASIQNLHRASKKYQVDGFQEVCESLLLAELNSSNALELLTFSMKFGARRLRKAAAMMIANSTD